VTPFRRVALAAGLASWLAVGAVACGISSDDKPRALDANDLPAALAANPSGTTVPGPSEGSRQSAKLYLVQTNGDTEILVSQPTPIPEVTDFTQLPRAVLEELIAQQPADASGGGSTLINAIPSTVQVLDATVTGNVLDLNLSDLGSVELTRQRQAAAQIVFTATALPGIDAVRFSIDGQQTAVPLDDQMSVPGEPVTRGDYPKLMPNP